MAPQLVQAAEYRKEFQRGRNRPLVLDCTLQDDTKAEFVVKLRASPAGEFGLACEVLCCRLAEALGLQTPEPALVEVTEEFAQSAPAEVRGPLIQSVGTNFGSRLLSGGYTTWPKEKGVPGNLRPVASEILAFDVFVQNPDRRPEKPNVLWLEDQVVILDHEMAFSFVYLIGAVEPWNDECANLIRSHLFFDKLRHNLDSIDRIAGAVHSLTIEELNAMVDELPTAWDSEQIARVRDYLPRRRDAAERWLGAIRRELL